jgi:hypothetical protein
VEIIQIIARQIPPCYITEVSLFRWLNPGVRVYAKYKAKKNLTLSRRQPVYTIAPEIIYRPERHQDRLFSAQRGLIFNDVDAIQQANQLFHQRFQ